LEAWIEAVLLFKKITWGDLTFRYSVLTYRRKYERTKNRQ